MRSSKPTARLVTLVLGMVTLLIFDLCPADNVNESTESTNLSPFIQKFVTHHTSQIRQSRQLIFVTREDASLGPVRIYAVEKKNDTWQLVFPAFIGSIGKNGFAAIGKKEEGDGKSPSGVFPLEMAFGYYPSVKTSMPYRQATEDDFWVDDPESEDYNKWVKGRPKAASWEKMKREDDRYKYGVVIGYNMHPIIKGKGSAIFLHVWKNGESTSGCVAMHEEKVLKILAWLDPGKKPMIVMGAEDMILNRKEGP